MGLFPKTVVSVPGSKSYTNRALVLAAMTPGAVRIVRPLESDDTRAMLGCLQTLGIEVRETSDAWEVVGDTRDVKPGNYDLDADLSGITIRFLLALSTVIPGVQVLHGKAGLNKRPIGPLVDGLRQLGAHIEYAEVEGFPPVRVLSEVLRPGTVTMPGDVSSQYFSALLQIAPLVREVAVKAVGDVEAKVRGEVVARVADDAEVIVKVVGEQISKPYIDMTLDTMREFGVKVMHDDYRGYTMAGGQAYSCGTYAVEGDLSSAGYFFALAALTESEITVRNVNPHSAQADLKFVGLLERMGNVVRLGEGELGGGEITLVGRGVRPGDYDMQDCPDQAMTMAVLAAFAPGVTVLRGVKSLRVKETERVVALEQELAKMGIRTASTLDTLTIYGGEPGAAEIDTYGDHRIAMAFAVAGTKIPGLVIRNPEVVGKTFPEFWEKLLGVMGGNVVLIGMRGTGKSTVGLLLAGALNKRFVDMDAEIVKLAGMSISEIVERYGWEHFRNLETALTRELGETGNLVIAAGGGVVLRPENVAALGARGTYVLLISPVNVLAGRIAGETDRPSLTAKKNTEEELEELWRLREAAYRRVARFVVETQNKKPEVVAQEIRRALSGAGL